MMVVLVMVIFDTFGLDFARSLMEMMMMTMMEMTMLVMTMMVMMILLVIR